MANNSIALEVRPPDVMGAYNEGVKQRIGVDKAKMDATERVMQLIGAASMHALGGKLDGTPDPQKFEEGLDMLQSEGVPEDEIAKFRGKPQLAPVAARASMTAMQQLQLAKSDRDYDLAMKKFEADIQGSADAGLTPVYGKDAQGNTVVMQPTKAGELKRSKMPDGVTIDLGVKTDEQAAGTARGKARGEAQVLLGGTLQQADQAIGLVDDLINAPGRETGTGLSATLDPRNYISGTDATNFKVRLDQVKGKAFLQAFAGLRGGGAITDVEGQKATEAIARLNTDQSDEEFKKSLDELKGILQVGKDRAIAMAADPNAARSPAADAPTPAVVAPAGPTGDVTSKEQYDALPPGAVFTSGGKQYKKPGAAQ
jgi:hypothetical protein